MTVVGLLIYIVTGLTLVGRASAIGPLVYFLEARLIGPVLFIRCQVFQQQVSVH